MADQVKEALAGASNQGRKVSDREGTKFSSPSSSPASGKVVKKAGAGKGVDPAIQEVGIRGATVASERKGAAYTVITNIVKPNAPEVTTTMQNAHILPSTTKRGFKAEYDIDDAH